MVNLNLEEYMVDREEDYDPNDSVYLWLEEESHDDRVHLLDFFWQSL